MGEQFFSGNYGKLAKIGLWACKITPKALFSAKKLWQIGQKSASGHVKFRRKLFSELKNYGKTARKPPQGM
jgi:hypothetical protein